MARLYPAHERCRLNPSETKGNAVTSRQVILVGGGTRSGKSDFALAVARRLGNRRLFVATAEPGDDEMHRRIRRHRETRGTDFETVEEPRAVTEIFRRVR